MVKPSLCGMRLAGRRGPLGGRNAQVGRGGEEGPDYPNGAGQAVVDGWLQLQGTVGSVNADALVLVTANGEEIIVEGRPWRIAQEQSCSAQVGGQMTLTGFYEDTDPSTELSRALRTAL